MAQELVVQFWLARSLLKVINPVFSDYNNKMSAEREIRFAPGLGEDSFNALGLPHFVNTLKAEFRGILANVLATEEHFGNEASVQRVADLCAMSCQELLLKQIDGSSILGAAMLQALKLPLVEPTWKTKALDWERASCAFFDLTDGDHGDSPDDVSTCASSSWYTSEMDLHEEDSIEFMFGEGLMTMDFIQVTDDVNALQKESEKDLEGHFEPSLAYRAFAECVAVPSEDLSKPSLPAPEYKRKIAPKLSQKDLLLLCQDVKHLRKEFEDSRAKPSVITGSGYPKSFRVLRAAQATRIGQAA